MNLKTIKHMFLAYVVLNTFVYKANQNSIIRPCCVFRTSHRYIEK